MECIPEMKLCFTFLLLLITAQVVFGQSARQDFEISGRLHEVVAEKVDSVILLSGNCRLIYSHNDRFRCLHLENASGEIFSLEIRYLDNYRGYVKLVRDLPAHALFEFGYTGSGRPAKYVKVNKHTFEKAILAKVPE